MSSAGRATRSTARSQGLSSARRNNFSPAGLGSIASRTSRSDIRSTRGSVRLYNDGAGRLAPTVAARTPKRKSLVRDYSARVGSGARGGRFNVSHGRQLGDVGYNVGRAIGSSLLASRIHNRQHDYYGHYSDHYEHLGGYLSLHGIATLGDASHYSPYNGHHSYYRSYYSPVYYPAYYRQPIYTRSYAYDDYDYPDTYNANTTVYIGDAAGSYEADYGRSTENIAQVYVEPAYAEGSTARNSVVYPRSGDTLRNDLTSSDIAIEGDNQASTPPSAAFIEQGNQAFSLGNYDQAQDFYLRAVLTDARDGYAKLFLGLASFAQGDFDMAVLGFRQAILLTDELLTQPIDLRQFYTDSNDLEVQLDLLERLVIREPANRDARFLLGYIYFSIGQSEKALTVLITLTDLYPNDELAASLRNAVDRMVTSAKAATKPADGIQRP